MKKCPPLHQLNNDTCIPLLTCYSSPSSPLPNNDTCVLECNSHSTNNTGDDSNEEDTTCYINGDIIVNGSIVETNVVTIVGIVNVSGNVVVTEAMTIKLAVGTVLHVGKCLVLEEGSEMIVVVEGDLSDINSSDGDKSVLLATYDGNCSSELTKRVKIERTSSFDECRDGQPKVQQMNDESGRTRLELVFVFMNDSSECIGSSSEINIVAIAIAVPIAVLVIVVIVVIMTVPTLRNKVFPYAKRRG